MNLNPRHEVKKRVPWLAVHFWLILLPIFQFSLVIRDRDGTESEENRRVWILPTPIPSSFWLRFRLHFLVFTLIDDDYNSNSISDSDISENQTYWCFENYASTTDKIHGVQFAMDFHQWNTIPAFWVFYSEKLSFDSVLINRLLQRRGLEVIGLRLNVFK